MNQILVTEKLYVTPELKRKKKIYKIYFIMSVFLVCILTSLYIYAVYDRNKNEQTSSAILDELNDIIPEDTTIADESILTVLLNGNDDDYEELEGEQVTIAEVNAQAKYETAKSGYRYKTIASISIEKINLTYPIIQGETASVEEIDALLKISPVKYHGGEPNEVGNFCIVGHNYRNTKFFSKVPTLEKDDTIQLTDLAGRTITYKVYEKHIVDEDDTRDTSQLTGGKKEVTLITCTDDSKQRVIVKCKEVK